MDDETGWTEILVDGWGPLVRTAVVDRVERATVGMRGVLVRTLARPDDAPYAATELLHRLVLDAIEAETGADLEGLGSQAAWACYDDAWTALAGRWAAGGALATVPAGREPAVTALLRRLPALAAEHAGMDAAQDPFEPLVVDGRMKIDVDGLFAFVARDNGSLGDDDRALIDRVVLTVRGR